MGQSTLKYHTSSRSNLANIKNEATPAWLDLCTYVEKKKVICLYNSFKAGNYGHICKKDNELKQNELEVNF